MKKYKYSEIVNKLNSTFMLVLLITVIGFILYLYIGAKNDAQRWEKPTIQTNNKKDNEEYIMGRLNNIAGSNTHYIELYSQSGSFSKYKREGDISNILFIKGENLENKCLYNTNEFKIKEFKTLPEIYGNNDDNKTVKVIYIETITTDTNKNKEIDYKDLIKISLAKPNTETIADIEKDIQAVLGFELVDDNKNIMIIFQKNNDIVLKKYALSNFKEIAVKNIKKN